MQIPELAAQLRKRLADKGLIRPDVLSRVSDMVIVDSFITCACCGEKQIEDAAILRCIIDQAESAEAFLNLCAAHSQRKH